jgi:hypothetical protein
MTATKKLELINWISKLNDSRILQKVDQLKNESIAKSKRRIFGSGKGIVSYISDDFDEPLDAFKAYEK